MIPDIFTIENGKAFIDANNISWIRKEDMLYYLMRLKEIWEEQLKCYEGQEDLAQFEYTRGKIDMLMFLIKELKGEF